MKVHPLKIIPLTFFLLLAQAAPVLPFSLEGRVKEFTLGNGIRVLMVERRQSPTISLTIRFRVGAVDENLGQTGTAHLLEHMLFKGTKTLGTRNYAEEEPILERMEQAARRLDAERAKGKNGDMALIRKMEQDLEKLQAEHRKWVVKDEIEFLYSQNGGVGFNAMTSADTTAYVVSLPANRLELWARIESDRILNPVLREFYSERDVVLEERRRSIDSQPERQLVENFLAAAFLAHPYGRPVIGWPSDVRFLDREETARFFRTFYSPANMVLALVGDLRPEEARPVVERYFGRIPSQPLPPPLHTTEPEQLGERRIQVVSPANPQLIIGFHKPNPPAADDAVCDMIEGLLSYGRTSRFYRRLVEEEKIATQVSASNGFPGERYANLFTIFAAPRNPHSAEELEKAIFAELDRLRTEEVPEAELKKVRNQMQAHFLRQLSSNSRLAYWLSYGQALFGDWRFIVRRLEAYEKVTAAEVRRVAGQYFIPRHRTVATLVRDPGGR